MYSPERSFLQRRSLRTTIASLATALLFAGLLASCATAPRAVLNVPGNYVADLWAATIEYPDGGPISSVLMCLDSESAVHLETGEGGQGAVGIIKLQWEGTVYEVTSENATTLTTPVLSPGCGLLTFGVDCCHIDHYLAIKATKV